MDEPGEEKKKQLKPETRMQTWQTIKRIITKYKAGIYKTRGRYGNITADVKKILLEQLPEGHVNRLNDKRKIKKKRKYEAEILEILSHASL